MSHSTQKRLEAVMGVVAMVVMVEEEDAMRLGCLRQAGEMEEVMAEVAGMVAVAEVVTAEEDADVSS